MKNYFNKVFMLNYIDVRVIKALMGKSGYITHGFLMFHLRILMIVTSALIHYALHYTDKK